MYPCLKFVSVCSLVRSPFVVSILLFSDSSHSPRSGHWLQQASPGSRCLGRSTGTGHELPSSLFLYLSLPAVPNQLLCSCPRLPMRMYCSRPWAPPPLTRPISNLPKHSLSSHTLFAWSPAPTRVFDDWQYCYALARISPLGPASFLLLLSPSSPQDEASDRTDRPTTENQAWIYLQDHGMRADGDRV